MLSRSITWSARESTDSLALEIACGSLIPAAGGRGLVRPLMGTIWAAYQALFNIGMRRAFARWASPIMLESSTTDVEGMGLNL